MKKQLEQRLRKLDAEYETGQKSLAELENQQAVLKNTLLCISSAFKVIKEELREEK
jgi:hypothetical protein